jgi:uncharacterized peroxidase-related enzyme
MSRIEPVDPRGAIGEVATLLSAVQRDLGATPNFIRILAHSAPALKAFLGLYAGAGEGQLDVRLRERIALAVAEHNACQYCVSAHSAIARKAGLDAAEIALARDGSATDPRSAAAVALAVSLLDDMGEITDEQFADARRAGLTDGEIVEVIVNVALNVLTNLIGKATRVEIDFPRIDLRRVA